MHLFATELLVDDRVRELIEDGPTIHGTTRIAAMVKRHEDDVAIGRSDAFAAALHPVFYTAAAISLLAFALTWMLREVPLRTQAHAGDAIPPPRDARSAVEAAS